jgi:hypothetical protein
MWNSNSLIAWLVARAGLDAEAIQPPTGGRAPGWNAGLVVARRQEVSCADASRARQPIRARASARRSAFTRNPPPNDMRGCGKTRTQKALNP